MSQLRTVESWDDGKVVHYTFEIDEDKLAQLAQRAAINKGKCARLGAVTVKVLTEEQAKFLRQIEDKPSGGTI